MKFYFTRVVAEAEGIQRWSVEASTLEEAKMFVDRDGMSCAEFDSEDLEALELGNIEWEDDESEDITSFGGEGYPNPDNNDTFYFIDEAQEVYPVTLFWDITVSGTPLSFMHPMSGEKILVSETLAKQWGPCVPKWSK